jgi:hypothetical protein
LLVEIDGLDGEGVAFLLRLGWLDASPTKATVAASIGLLLRASAAAIDDGGLVPGAVR